MLWGVRICFSGVFTAALGSVASVCAAGGSWIGALSVCDGLPANFRRLHQLPVSLVRSGLAAIGYQYLPMISNPLSRRGPANLGQTCTQPLDIVSQRSRSDDHFQTVLNIQTEGTVSMGCALQKRVFADYVGYMDAVCVVRMEVMHGAGRAHGLALASRSIAEGCASYLACRSLSLPSACLSTHVGCR